MQMLLTEFREEYRELLLDFLWRQWDALGVAGTVEGDDSWLIDPEALLAFTCTVGRHDARLFDEVIDWLHKNGAFINTQRLKRVLRKERFAGTKVLAAVAGLLNRGTDALKWRSLAIVKEKKVEPEPLFYFKDGNSAGQWGEAEPHFQQYGFLRGRLELRGYSRRFRPNTTTNLIPQLRSLFGVSGRCEVLAYLLTHKDAHPSEVARETYYCQKTVQDSMVDMNSSGIVNVRTKGKEKRYWIQREQWAALLNREDRMPQWVTWPPMFAALERVWLALTAIVAQDTSDKLRLTAHLFPIMQEIRPMIQRAGFQEALSGERLHVGEEHYDAFLNDIKRLLGYLTPDKAEKLRSGRLSNC